MQQVFSGIRPSGVKNAGLPLSYSSDQLNAVPQFWTMLNMVRPVLTLEVTRKRWGLSNWLAFHGSGQSKKTEEFFNKWWKTRVPQTAADMKSLVTQAGSLIVKNSKVWGQPSVAISMSDARIDGWFSPTVMDAWEEFVSEHRHAKPTWSTFDRFVQSLGVIPFKSKECLGRLHVVNRFAELGFCELPTMVELGEWIADHPNLGAFGGLETLGFRMTSKNDVVLAISMINKEIIRVLGVEERKEISYSGITLENALCKVSRLFKFLPKLRKNLSLWVWAVTYLELAGVNVVNLDVTSFKNGADSYMVPSISVV
ncbi:hypothetical protein EXIGLDRAFT_694709 [Exidia glandulosa HHB12029]|uniref:Uncharacterized protein n=1 Tax=Exidia glandulosa HHB12029 TaxID=1314781 RepID=A0A165GDR2_EXIGL|nr:hypothetical protein EXIGLDRAFT_694709 [Exidia glandulosa HHB12029]